MKIAIACIGEQEYELLAQALSCFPELLGGKSPPELFRHDLSQPQYAPVASDVNAAFVVIDSMSALEGALRFGAQNADLPFVVVSHVPDYALEAIRLGALHYLIYPLDKKELACAMRRLRQKEGVSRENNSA